MTISRKQIRYARLPKTVKQQMRADAGALFEQIIAQARLPVFYASLGVPDTVEGRFEVITLHMFVILRRLQDKTTETDEDPSSSAAIHENCVLFAQYIFDAMFGNMDDNLRELGVGDLSVGKKIRALAEAFYGRVGAYEAALKSDNPAQALCAAIGRNILPLDGAAADAKPAGPADPRAILADYILRANAGLMQRSRDRLVMGVGYFPQIRYGISFRS